MTEPDPLQEASDPATDPERLRELASYKGKTAVRRAAWRNPSLPEEVWFKVLFGGEPEAWANPMAPIYLMSGLHQAETFQILVGAREAARNLSMDPNRCSSDGKALLVAKIQESLPTLEEKPFRQFLGEWLEAINPETPPERLRDLSYSVATVQREALRNPSLPDDIWWYYLPTYPATWDNPMAPIYVLSFSPPPGYESSLSDVARSITMVMIDPDGDSEITCEKRSKQIISDIILQWWNQTDSPGEMIDYVSAWSKIKKRSFWHRELVRILIACLLTIPAILDGELEAIEILENFVVDEGLEENSLKDVLYAAKNWAVKFALRTSLNPHELQANNFVHAVSSKVVQLKSGGDETSTGIAAKEHHQLLADLIRQVMPVPPVVE